MKICKLAAHFVALFLLIGVAGCVSIKRPYPDKKFYLFEIEREADADGPVHPDVMLQVKPFTISPRYEGQEFVYRVGEMRYESDFYNQFFLAPSGLLTEATIQWLGETGLFGAVFGATAPVRPTHYIAGSITSLVGDYTGAGAKGIVRAQILLTREDASAPAIVMQHDYEASIEAKGSGAEGMMAAWNEGYEKILMELETDLRALSLKPAE